MGYTINCKGLDFECFIYKKEIYERKFKEHESAAFTDTFTRQIHFMEEGFSEALCRHEITHAYGAACFLTDVDPNGHQAEEVFACINECHGPELMQQAKELYENLKNSLQS